MIRIDFLDQAGGLREPADESVADSRIFGKAARFVPDLPGKDGRILTVRLAGDGVGAADDGLQVVEKQLLGGFTYGELRHLLHERPVAVFQRNEGRLAGGPFQILAITARPFPGIVQIQDCLHVPFPDFQEETVQTGQNRIIVHRRSLLQGRFDPGIHAVRTISAHEDAEIVDAQGLQGVQFADQTFEIAAFPFGGQDRSVPEIGSDVCIRLSVTDKLPVGNGNERKMSGTTCHEQEEQRKDSGFRAYYLHYVADRVASLKGMMQKYIELMHQTNRKLSNSDTFLTSAKRRPGFS